MASANNTRLLILGGTTEAYLLADALVADARVQVFNSFAGRTPNPRLPAGETRIGGFGGVAGLARYLTATCIDAVVDATHPFASRMGWNAASACASTGTPLLRLERPAWTAAPDDRWESVEDWEQAVRALSRLGAKRVFLAVGRQEVAPFAVLRDTWLLVRAVSPPDPMPAFARAELLLARGPFDLPSERALLGTYAIDCDRLQEQRRRRHRRQARGGARTRRSRCHAEAAEATCRRQCSDSRSRPGLDQRAPRLLPVPA